MAPRPYGEGRILRMLAEAREAEAGGDTQALTKALMLAARQVRDERW